MDPLSHSPGTVPSDDIETTGLAMRDTEVTSEEACGCLWEAVGQAPVWVTLCLLEHTS